MNTTETINKIIAERRIIKPEDFSGEIIEDSTITQIIENAHWAPNHGRTEPWEFFVFSGEGRKKMGQINLAVYQQITAEPDPAVMEKLSSRPLLASHIIGVCMKRGTNPKIPRMEEILATACAVQNMLLTAHTYGLGAYWSTGSYTHSSAINHHFGLSEEDLFLGYIYLGKMDKTNPTGKRNQTGMAKTVFIK